MSLLAEMYEASVDEVLWKKTQTHLPGQPSVYKHSRATPKRPQRFKGVKAAKWTNTRSKSN